MQIKGALFTIIRLQCCILAHTSLSSPAYVRFWPTVRQVLAHCTSLFGPVAMPTNDPPPPHTHTHTNVGGTTFKKKYKPLIKSERKGA